MSDTFPQPILESIRAIIGSQHGVISRQQAIEAGLSARQVDHRIKNGEWRKLFSGVYADANTHSFRTTLAALSMWCRGAGAISHRAAAWLWEMRVSTSTVPEVTVTNNRRPPRTDIRLHHSTLPTRDVTTVGSIRLTTPSRTLVDLAGVLTPEEFEICMDDAFRRRLTSPPRLKWQSSTTTGRGKKGSTVVNDVLKAREGSTPRDSGLETRIGRAIRQSKLCQPVAQHSIVHDAEFIARVDFAWPEEKVLVECESYQWHAGRQEWRRDAARLNEVTSFGWLALRATEDDARDPRPLIQKLGRALEERRRR